MSTSIATLNANTELTELEQMILAEMAQEDTAYRLQPARIKIAPGGIGQFLVGDETVKSFSGIVALSQIVRGYWPSSGTGEAPLCSSPDGMRGYFREPTDREFQDAASSRNPHLGIIALSEKQPLPESYACMYCPMNQWGSEHQRRGGQGRGKACKEMRRLLIIPDGWSLPAIFTLPPTSIGAWDTFCSSQASRKSAYFATQVKFTLDTDTAQGGESYNKVKVEAIEKITDPAQLQAIMQIRKEFREYISQSPVDAAEYETVPPESEQSAQPARGKRTKVDATTGEILDAPSESEQDSLPF